MKKILGIVVLLVVVIGAAFVLRLCGFGLGLGNGGGDGAVASSKMEDIKEEQDDKGIILIKVDESTIYFDNEKCENVDDLKKKICKIQATNKEKKYVYNNEYAIKETDDQVKEALQSLKDTLEIIVDFNE